MVVEKYEPNQRVKEYFHILSARFPKWLNDYINTTPLLKQQYISMTCGTIYTDLFDNNFFYSSLDHSVAVALIIWHFTHDKKQTLSGLFHDIATPAFKHCVDFLNGDYIKQESTEDLTTDIIEHSKEIMALLQRDGIKLSEVDNYHLYPIADNDTPKLSADRLEYSLSNALFSYNLLNIDDIKEIYTNLSVQQNSEQEIELGFKSKKAALKFVKTTSAMSVIYRDDRTRYSMQFIADILKRLNLEGKITKSDLYEMKEAEIINLIKESKYNSIFEFWRNAKEIKTSSAAPEGVYSVHLDTKVRYIDPLLGGQRISSVNDDAKSFIQHNLSYNMGNFCYLDFDFPA
ncbi:hypothetical protein J6V85_04010 [Candidatus Saccharibacteria bacterium]|nr:hypothetical protein [Candidatus Saccharibacteria bacterium]